MLGNTKLSILSETMGFWAYEGLHEMSFIASGLDLGSNLIPSSFAIVESSSFSLREDKGSIEFSYYVNEYSMYIYMAGI